MRFMGIALIFLLYMSTAYYLVVKIIPPIANRYLFSSHIYHKIGGFIFLLVFFPASVAVGYLMSFGFFIYFGMFIAGEIGAKLLFYYGFFATPFLMCFTFSLGARLAETIFKNIRRPPGE